MLIARDPIVVLGVGVAWVVQAQYMANLVQKDIVESTTGTAWFLKSSPRDQAIVVGPAHLDAAPMQAKRRVTDRCLPEAVANAVAGPDVYFSVDMFAWQRLARIEHFVEIETKWRAG
jgi:hypothetical protein